MEGEPVGRTINYSIIPELSEEKISVPPMVIQSFLFGDNMVDG